MSLDCSELKRDDIVILAAGSEVRSMHPRRNRYVTKRRQAVKVFDTYPAMTQRICYMDEHERGRYPHFAEKFAAYDFLLLDAETNPDEDAASMLLREAYGMIIEIQPAVVTWPGAGGYWNEAPIFAFMKAA